MVSPSSLFRTAVSFVREMTVGHAEREVTKFIVGLCVTALLAALAAA